VGAPGGRIEASRRGPLRRSRLFIARLHLKSLACLLVGVDPTMSRGDVHVPLYGATTGSSRRFHWARKRNPLRQLSRICSRIRRCASHSSSPTAHAGFEKFSRLRRACNIAPAEGDLLSASVRCTDDCGASSLSYEPPLAEAAEGRPPDRSSDSAPCRTSISAVRAPAALISERCRPRVIFDHRELSLVGRYLPPLGAAWRAVLQHLLATGKAERVHRTL